MTNEEIGDALEKLAPFIAAHEHLRNASVIVIAFGETEVLAGYHFGGTSPSDVYNFAGVRLPRSEWRARIDAMAAKAAGALVEAAMERAIGSVLPTTGPDDCNDPNCPVHGKRGDAN